MSSVDLQTIDRIGLEIEAVESVNNVPLWGGKDFDLAAPNSPIADRSCRACQHDR
jgi:hypothetical protein